MLKFDLFILFTIVPTSSSSSFTPIEEALMMIMSMGFTRDQGIKALKATVSLDKKLSLGGSFMITKFNVHNTVNPEIFA